MPFVIDPIETPISQIARIFDEEAVNTQEPLDARTLPHRRSNPKP